jgi:DNA-binding NarL/FixJ family response regulator
MDLNRRRRVLLGDDHTLVLEGFRRILETEFDVVGTAEDGKTLVREAARLNPDVILVDISLPVLNGIEAARRIKQRQPAAKIVFLTMHSDLTYLRDALRLGASGYVLKTSAGKELVNAVRAVLAGKNYVTPELTKAISDSQAREAFERGQVPALTARQSEVLKLIASGRSDEQIALELRVALRTVRFHRRQIGQKLGISGTAALTKYAVAHGLVREGPAI